MREFEKFYRSKLTNIRGQGEQRTADCPFCKHKRDFSFRIDTGQCKCFQCGFEGDTFSFYQKLHPGSTFLEAKKELAKFGIEPLGKNPVINQPQKITRIKDGEMEEKAEKFTDNLNGELRTFLKEARGLTNEVIDKYKLGFVIHPEYSGSKRLTIPIPKDGKYVNIRFHSLKDEKPKDLPFTKDLPYATYLFPEDQLNNNEIWLCEGELDALCAISHGLPAISVTGGAGSWRDEFTSLFKNKKVSIVYDCDEAGRKGAGRVGEILSRVAEVKVINLELGKGEDLTDWFMKYKKDPEELKKLAERVKVYEAKKNLAVQKPSKKGFSPRSYSVDILKNYSLIYDRYKRFWIYEKTSGIWKGEAELLLNSVLRKEILGSEDFKRYCVGEIIADLQGLTYDQEVPEEPEPHLIPFRNKVYDLKKEKFLDYSPDYFFINKLAVGVNEKHEDCPTIDKVFSEIVDPGDMITLYEMIAYSLWRGYPYPKLFILYGSGGNGKSVFTKILTRILGRENVSLISSVDLQNNRFASSNLYGKLINISGEMEYNILKNTSRLKQSCGEDLISCERKFREPFPFMNYAKMIFLTNQVPMTMDKTFAFYRRIFLLEFPHQFVIGENADPLIVEKIPEEEFEGLAWRCLSTLKGLFENNFVFTKHEKTETVTNEYEDLSNPLGKFLKENTEKEPNSDIPVGDFSEKYISYLKQNGFRIWTNREISRVMREKGYRREVVNKALIDGEYNTYRAWLGLKWR